VDARLMAGHDAGTEARGYITTPTVAKHRLFVWTERAVCPDHQHIVIARDDDTTFGILHSRFHEAWSLRLGTWLGVGNDPRYTPTTTFETFSFPEGLTPDIPAADTADDPRAEHIAPAAKRLDELRRAWLNPPDLVDIAPEVTPTAAPGEAPRRYPDRLRPKTEAAVKLKERTLTNLYNQRPRWLADSHEALDRAVAASHGWPEDISTEDALAAFWRSTSSGRGRRRGKSALTRPALHAPPGGRRECLSIFVYWRWPPQIAGCMRPLRAAPPQARIAPRRPPDGAGPRASPSSAHNLVSPYNLSSSATLPRLPPTNPWLIGDPSVYFPWWKSGVPSGEKGWREAPRAEPEGEVEREGFFLLESAVTH
jgi:hypothetical protein